MWSMGYNEACQPKHNKVSRGGREKEGDWGYLKKL